MRERLRQDLGVLRHRPFRLLCAARTASVLGSGLTTVALAFAVLELPGAGAGTLGLVLAAKEVPTIAFVLFAGAVADRIPRARLMAAADFLAFASQAGVAALILLGPPPLWALLTLCAVNGTAIAFFLPASTGLLPATVPPEQLQQANGVLQLSTNAARVAGAALAGLLVAAVGPGWALAADAATYLLSGVLITRIRVPFPQRTGSTRLLGDLRQGWREFSSRQWVWAVVLCFTFYNLAFGGGLLVVGPLVAQRELGGPAAWGVITAALSAGLVSGVVVALRIRPRRPVLVAMLATLGLLAPLLMLAAGAPVVLLAAVMFAYGGCITVFDVLWETALQQHVPEELLSRVSAYDWLGSMLATPVGLVLAGTLADRIGTDATLWAAAALVVVSVGLCLLSPQVRRLPAGGPAPAPAAPAGAA